MARLYQLLISLTISSSLFGCQSTEDQNRTGNQVSVNATKPDSVSEVTTDSQRVVNNKLTEKSEPKTNPDSANFHKVLTFKNIEFKVKASGKGSLQQVTIQPSGLTATNRAETIETEPVVGTEIGDLNADGFPELLIFTQSAGSGSYGKVIAFSVNNGKSMSQVSFPETSQIAEIKNGYSGHDKFSVVGNTLIQEFPIYYEGDVNSKISGKKRQITYKLKNGENSRFFEVDQVKEVSAK